MNRSLKSFVRIGKHACIFTVITLGTTTRCANTSDGQLAQGQGTAVDPLQPRPGPRAA